MDNSNILDGVDVVRAWKDEEYRSSLSDAQRAALPESPADLGELSDEQLDGIAGGSAAPGGGGTKICTNTIVC
jgi:mersacidin/lichenicidin family type 2 lantibiotic